MSASEKNSIVSPAETLNEREGYDDVDVFGHEEEHDVCGFYIFIYLFIDSLNLGFCRRR